MLKAIIVLAYQKPPLSHDLSRLSDLAGVGLSQLLQGLQPFAAKATNNKWYTTLHGERQRIH